jgi:hypothetical protein
MNTNRDHLDDAIDAFAARMTRVEENDAFAARVLASLPDRSPWILHSWIPRLAITAGLAGITIVVVLQPFSVRSTTVLRSAVLSSPSVELAIAALEYRTTVEPPSIVRRTFVERPQNDRRTSDVADFERSLPALGAVTALVFDSLAPVSLPEDAALTLLPLATEDLPLTAETISPR